MGSRGAKLVKDSVGVKVDNKTSNKDKPLTLKDTKDADSLREKMLSSPSIGDVKDYVWRATMNYVQSMRAFTLNQKLRDGKDLEPGEANRVQKMDKAMRPLPTSLKLYRFDDMEFFNSLGLSAATAQRFFSTHNPTDPKTLIGKKFTKKDYTSTSYSIDKNLFTNRKVMLNMVATKGTKAIVTTNDSESEIILGRGTKFTVKNARMDNGQLLIDVEAK